MFGSSHIAQNSREHLAEVHCFLENFILAQFCLVPPFGSPGAQLENSIWWVLFKTETQVPSLIQSPQPTQAEISYNSNSIQCTKLPK